MPLPTLRALAAGAVLCALAIGPFLPARVDGKKQAVQPADLRRGLVTTYTGTKRGAGPVERLEPIVGVALKAGEAPDPRLGGDGGKVVWRGYLNVLRGGAYTFSARVRGEFLLEVGGKEVLAAKKG